MPESLARRLSLLGSSGYIKVGGSRDAEGPWREPATAEPDDHLNSVHKAVAAAVGVNRGER
jgi:hypothetical protein